jgi:hypothetical protein
MSCYAIQGGVLVFNGDQLILEHLDEGPGAHARLDDILQVLRQ